MKYQKLAIAAAIPNLSFAVIAASPVQAATITYNFKADVTSGSLLGQTFTGLLSYDDSTLTKVGPEFLSPAEGLKVSFNFLGTAYTEKNDVTFQDFPLTNFNNGVFEGLDFAVNNSQTIFVINQDQFSYKGEQIGNVTYQSVPEPDTVAGLAIFCAGSLFLKKKRKTIQ